MEDTNREISRIQDKLKEYGFPINKLIAGSKTLYHRAKPSNFTLFNGNIFVDGLGKVWYGDLDITEDYNTLVVCAKECGVVFYMLHEMDGRFGNEDRDDFKEEAVINTKGEIKDSYKEILTKHLTLKNPYKYNL